MKRILAIVVAVLFLPSACLAMSLEEAKSKGYLGETESGYLELVDAKAPSEAAGLLHEVNRKRREEYQSIAAKNGASLQAVELLAGKKAIEKTPSGHFIKVDSAWVRK